MMLLKWCYKGCIYNKKDIFKKFRETIGLKIENIIETEYVFKKLII